MTRMTGSVPALVLAALAVMAVPDTADAQRRGERYNPFSFTPYAGLYRDAFDASDDQLGWLAGFRAGYHESERISLYLNFGYARVDDIGSPAASTPSWDAEWVILTAGGDYALVPGPTSIAAGAEAGVGWRNTRLASGGSPGEGEGWGSYAVLAPSLALRHRLSPNLTVEVVGRNLILDVFESARHSQSLTLGLSIR